MTRCCRAFDVDLVDFVYDARGARWAAFREHYPLCAECSLEVRMWTEIEIVLQGGAPPATTHPAPDDLLQLELGEPALDPEYRRIVEYHVASCRPCADEIAALRAFDFSTLQATPAVARTIRERVPMPEPIPAAPPAAVTAVRRAAEPARAQPIEPRTAERAPASAEPLPPQSASAVAEIEAADEPRATAARGAADEPVTVTEPAPADEAASVAEPGPARTAVSLTELVPAEEHSSVAAVDDDSTEVPSPAVMVDDSSPSPADAAAGDLTPDAEQTRAGAMGVPPADVFPTLGVAARMARVARHPAMGVSLVAVLLLPVLWIGELPRFPFGAPAGRVPYDLPEARVAVATARDTVVEIEEVPSLVYDAEITFPSTGSEIEAPPLVGDEPGEEFPSALSGIETEALPPAEDDPAAMQLSLARGDTDVLADAPGVLVPEEAADADDAAQAWVLARLDDAAPVEVVGAALAAGIELEVPVPRTVPAGAVLQVQIRGEGTREIVERLSFPGAGEVALRVPAGWLVPGRYEIEVGVVRRGPAPVRVAHYGLVVR